MYNNVVAAAVELASETCCRVKWSKQKRMYECTRCGYTSERKSNVGRHFRRIHCELKKHKICVVCEESFSTKGEFYEHCEKEHPHLRNSSFITSEKYKIGRKQNRRRRNQTRSIKKTRATSYKRVFIDETSEAETSDSTLGDDDNENFKRFQEDPVELEMEVQKTSEETEVQKTSEETEVQKTSEETEVQKTSEETEVQKTSEETEGHQEDIKAKQNNQKDIDEMNHVQKVDKDVESNCITLLMHKGNMEKVIVQEISKVYAPIPYPTTDNDDSSSWSHKANESLVSSPVRSLRSNVTPILWSPSYSLSTTPRSLAEPDEATSSPARTINTDDFIFSPARSFTSDDYLSSPAEVYENNEFMSPSSISSNSTSSTFECSPKPLSSGYCNISSSLCSDASVKVNTYPSVSALPLKKRFGNFTQRKHLADITNVLNNELNVKSRFNNNEMQVTNRNFSETGENQKAFFKNIDFDDLEAVLILKSLKESNH